MQKINNLIDHTCLTPDASSVDIKKLVEEAQKYNFNSICIRPKFLKDFGAIYPSSAVIDFPQKIYEICSSSDLDQVVSLIGSGSLISKQEESQKALSDGVLELDPVINISNIKGFNEKALVKELEIYINVAKDLQVFIKPIFSAEILDDKELEFSIKEFSQIVLEHYKNNPQSKLKFAYKNSTGFIKSSNNFPLRTTSVELIQSITKYLNQYDPEKRIYIKAAGGIKSYDQALEIIEAAQGRLSHIGTSSGIQLVENNKSPSTNY